MPVYLLILILLRIPSYFWLLYVTRLYCTTVDEMMQLLTGAE